MSQLQKANDLFKAGRYEEAIKIYETLINEAPHFKSICSYNLSLAKKRVTLIDPVVEQVPVAGKEEPEVKTVVLGDLYKEVAEAIAKIPNYKIENEPLVSVLMTSHNVEEYVAEAVMSVLRQSYQNLEVIIVDDCSTDKTREILDRLKNASPKVKIRFLNANLGTYYAKNTGLQMAKGEYIFFQDADDICHPERIKLSMLELMKEGIVCVRTCYSRVLFPEGIVLSINNLRKKLGLICTGYRRFVFKEIGYFNCTSKASDDEFFNRARHFYGRAKFLDVNLPLYFNTYRDNSLFADMVAVDPRLTHTIEQIPSESRQKYLEAFTALHKDTDKAKLKDIFKFPMIRDPIPVSADMTNLSNPKIPVVGNICTFPDRLSTFKKVLEKIVPQVDELNIYLDKYPEVPEFLKDLPIKTTIFTNTEYPNLRDNGKLLGLSKLDKECYYFTFDDDIEYPSDYVHALLKKIEEYERLAVVGVHGVVLPEIPSGYFTSYRMVYTFMKKLEADRLVSNLGTGTVAFHSSLVKGLTHKWCESTGMLDIYFSVYCKKNNIPMIAIKRHDGWMTEFKVESNNGNLYLEFKDHDDTQAKLIKDNLPWGYTGIDQVISRNEAIKKSAIATRLSELKPLLHQIFL